MTGLFHITQDNKITVMLPSPFENEAVLQGLIQSFPSVLDGAQFPGAVPRQWVLVAREMPVPDGDGSDRWSLDHLLLDQDSVPTLIEVKRRRDGRSRREVIGQMFDYAANGSSYWPIETLKACFEKTCGGVTEATKRLSEFLQDEQEPERFWETVERNLRSGRVRLIFLLDEVPSELLRIIEFLGQHFKTEVEVYAVEVRQFIGDTGRLLSTRVLGVRSPSTSIQTQYKIDQFSVEEWLARLQAKAGQQVAAIAAQFAGWMEKRGRLFTTPAQNPALGMSVIEGTEIRYPFSISPAGKANINLCYLAYSDAYRDPTSIRALVDEAAPVLGIDPKKVNLGGVMGLKLDELAANPEKCEALTRTLDSIVRRLTGQPVPGDE